MKARRDENMSTPFGGMVPVWEQMKAFGIPKLLDECLGERVKQCKYSYKDAIVGWILTNLSGGKRLAHIDEKKRDIKLIPELKFPSQVTLGRIFKKLSTEIETTKALTRHGKNSKISVREINDNLLLADLLIRMSKIMGLLKEGVSYVLDIDAVFIKTDNFEAKYSGFQRAYGFYPMVALIDDIPVFIEMRNGNVVSRYGHLEFMEKCLKLLGKHNITIGKVRADSASFNKDLFEYFEENDIEFCVNTKFPKPIIDKKTKKLGEVQPLIHNAINRCTNYQNTAIETSNHTYNCEIGDVDYTMHKGKYAFRLVIARLPIRANPNKERLDKLKEKKIVRDTSHSGLKGWKTLNGYYHKLIYTNDYHTDSEDIIKEYMDRGNSERKFDFLKNGCNWNLPPFSTMTHNTVFLYIASMANNVFRAIAKKFSKEVSQIRPKMRLETFTSVFMIITCELIKDVYVFWNTDVQYENIIQRLDKESSEKNS